MQRVAEFQAEAALGVDWSSLPAFEGLQASLGSIGLGLTYIYLNYRQGCCLQCFSLLLNSRI